MKLSKDNSMCLPLGQGYYILADWRQFILAKERKEYTESKDRFEHIGFYTNFEYLLKSYALSRLRVSGCKNISELRDSAKKIRDELRMFMRHIESFNINMKITIKGDAE